MYMYIVMVSIGKNEEWNTKPYKVCESLEIAKLYKELVLKKMGVVLEGYELGCWIETLEISKECRDDFNKFYLNHLDPVG